MTHISIIKSCAVKFHKSHDKLSTLAVKAWEKAASRRGTGRSSDREWNMSKLNCTEVYQAVSPGQKNLHLNGGRTDWQTAQAVYSGRTV